MSSANEGHSYILGGKIFRSVDELKTFCFLQMHLTIIFKKSLMKIRMYNSFFWRMRLFFVALMFLLISFVGASDFFLVEAATPFTQAYTTMSNSRFSYKARVGSSTVPQNTSLVTIVTSGQSDNDTNNLFIGDVVCFNNPDAGTKDGCQGQATYTVDSVPSGSEFNTATNLSGALTIGTAVVATQSGRMTLTFKPNTLVPSGGYLRITIPAATANYADGIPDSGGFDSAKLPSNLIGGDSSPQTGGSCGTDVCVTPTGFTVSTATLSSAASAHTVLIGIGSTLASGVQYSVALGHSSDATLRFLNPSPSGTSHQRGVSDSLSVVLQSETSGNTALDSTTTKVNPVDGVFVSANVELTLSYTISGRTSPAVGCGKTSVQSSTATAVPFGSISSFASFYDMSQTHTLTTNAYGGYILQAYQDGPLTTTNGSTIPNTVCDSACTTTSSTEWNTTSNYGFGYSLQNVSGGTTPFNWNDSARTFNARPFPTSSSPITIFSNTAPANGHSLYTCYRLNVANTFTAGLYYNKLTYIATPIFQ